MKERDGGMGEAYVAHCESDEFVSLEVLYKGVSEFLQGSIKEH